MSFPPLPNTNNQFLSPNFLHAAQILCDIFQAANHALSQGNFDLHRLKFHQEAIGSQAFSLLVDIEASSEEEGIPDEWIRDVVKAFGNLLAQIQTAKSSALGMYVVKLLLMNYLIFILQSGRPLTLLMLIPSRCNILESAGGHENS